MIQRWPVALARCSRLHRRTVFLYAIVVITTVDGKYKTQLASGNKLKAPKAAATCACDKADAPVVEGKRSFRSQQQVEQNLSAAAD